MGVRSLFIVEGILSGGWSVKGNNWERDEAVSVELYNFEKCQSQDACPPTHESRTGFVVDTVVGITCTFVTRQFFLLVCLQAENGAIT